MHLERLEHARRLHDEVCDPRDVGGVVEHAGCAVPKLVPIRIIFPGVPVVH